MSPARKDRPERGNRRGVASAVPASGPLAFAMQPIIGTNGRVPKSARPSLAEPTFMHIYVLMEERGGFQSMEELDDLLARYAPPGKKPRFPPARNPWHQAQEMAYRGWQAGRAGGRKSAARKSLQISPDAVDGYLLLAHDAATWAEAESLCRQAVAAGERLMASSCLEDFTDAFWGAAITRPYMRARFALGYCLWQQGKRAEAATQFQDLLRLNRQDNQGARYVLVAILLEERHDREARNVMARFSQDPFCFWNYNDALVAFRQYGDGRKSRGALAQALRRNPFVPFHLLKGPGELPSDSTFIIPGEESAAVEYAMLYRNAWSMTPGAMDWLEGLSTGKHLPGTQLR